MRSREFTQGVEIRCRAVNSADRGRRNIAADQQQIRLQLLHQVEFVLCAGKVARALRLGHALEIAKRLKRTDGKTEIPAELANVARAPIEREQVILENLDRVEAGAGDGAQLFVERSAQRYCGDGKFGHASCSSGSDPRRAGRQVVLPGKRIGCLRGDQYRPTKV